MSINKTFAGEFGMHAANCVAIKILQHSPQKEIKLFLFPTNDSKISFGFYVKITEKFMEK